MNRRALLSLEHRFMFQPQTQGIAVLALDLQPEAMCERQKKLRSEEQIKWVTCFIMNLRSCL